MTDDRTTIAVAIMVQSCGAGRGSCCQPKGGVAFLLSGYGPNLANAEFTIHPVDIKVLLRVRPTSGASSGAQAYRESVAALHA